MHARAEKGRGSDEIIHWKRVEFDIDTAGAADEQRQAAIYSTISHQFVL
jgi:hypothetical protein